jgi:hypothetical protein
MDLVEGSISRGRSVKVSGDSMVGECETRGLCRFYGGDVWERNNRCVGVSVVPYGLV